MTICQSSKFKVQTTSLIFGVWYLIFVSDENAL